jgi:signal peptidase II
MKQLIRFAWVMAILLVCTSCDQMVKGIARNALLTSEPVSIWNDLVRMEYVENPGVVLGMGATLPYGIRIAFIFAFVAISLGVTLFFAFRLPPSLRMIQLAALAFVSAGGLGNLLDRIFNHGQVIDFVSFGVGPLRTGIMNLADMAIFFGALIFLLFYKQQPHPETPVAA